MREMCVCFVRTVAPSKTRLRPVHGMRSRQASSRDSPDDGANVGVDISVCLLEPRTTPAHLILHGVARLALAATTTARVASIRFIAEFPNRASDFIPNLCCTGGAFHCMYVVSERVITSSCRRRAALDIEHSGQRLCTLAWTAPRLGSASKPAMVGISVTRCENFPTVKAVANLTQRTADRARFR
jgi:hypothetical protein